MLFRRLEWDTSISYHADISEFQRVNESCVGGEAIRMASLKSMTAKQTHDEIVPDSEEEWVNSSRRPKRRRCNKYDEKYDAMFDLLTKAEERSQQMEMHMVENQKAAFEQAEKALELYNKLSERLIHAIINIGGSDDTSG